MARPPRLLVVADGPRDTHPEDSLKTAEVRNLIERGVDWDCEVVTNYSDKNLGCARRVASGLDWAFSKEERLIVLEDDCLPDFSFFRFCDELLERYKDDKRVAQICGCPKAFSQVRRNTSYVFTRFGPIWGWASWRRAWEFYDLEMKDWPQVKSSGRLRAYCQSDAEYRKRVAIYDAHCPTSSAYNPKSNTWDYQWSYARLANGMVNIMPTVNLIKNIGFDGSGTHTTGGTFTLKQFSLDFPLVHPSKVAIEPDFEKMYSKIYSRNGLGVRRLCRRVQRYFYSLLNKLSVK